MRSLIGYALDGGADAVLLGCSMYGPVAEEFAAERPVLSSDAALFGEVVRLAPKRVHVLGPIEAGTRDTVESLQATVGAAAAVFGSVVTGVREARAEGDTERAARLAAKRAPVRARFPGADMSTLVVGSERFHIHRITGLAPAGRPCTPRIVLENLRRHHQDVCLGTDSHTTMVNGLGVLGWGIEAEAAMFGHSLSMLVSPVVAPTAWSASSSSSPRGLTTSSPLRRPCRARRVPGKVSTPANSKPARKLPKLLPGQRKH